MNGMLHIDRVVISLHGVSSQVVEAAVSGLEQLISRRLGCFTVGGVEPLHLGDLALPPIHTQTVLDASALRGIIADRLIEAIRIAADTSGALNREEA